MRTINIKLSEGGISQAIRDLQRFQHSIDRKSAKLVDELVNGGYEMARFAFGNTASVDRVSEEGFGMIEAVGEAVTIMEFGAGVATMESHPLAENSPHLVKEWEYSRTEGSGEGYLTGRWHFPPGSDIEYDRIEPRHGILDARDYIVNNLETKARSVFK